MAQAQSKPQPTERMYQIIVKPLVTEKTTKVSEGNWVTFEVAQDATKPEIRVAIERLFGVDVLKVNTLNQQGKTKKFRGFAGKRSDQKKAYVKLKDGQSIDMASA